MAGAVDPPHRARGFGAGVGFWVVAFGFVVVMSLGTVPTPLYVLYEARDGLSAAVMTIVFAAYAAGVLGSLFLLGHLSDRLGRRRMLVGSVLLSIASALLFATWPELAGLLLARVLSGISVGMATATAIAYLGELHAVARPGAGRRRANVVGTAANLGGLALGPLVAGLLADLAPRPLELPFWTYLVLLGVALLLLSRVPETVTGFRAPYRPQRIVVPPGARGRFAAAAFAAFVGFSLFGLFAALGPAFMLGTLHRSSHTLGGLTTTLTFGTAAVAQSLVRDPTRRRPTLAGFAAIPLGLALVVAAAWWVVLPLWVVGEILVGAGVGLVFAAAVGVVAVSTPQENRAEALAGLFLAAYLGLALPVLGLGVAIELIPLAVALTVFAGLAAAGAVAAGWVVLRANRDLVPEP
ncbi:MFS transporter [Pseudonocardia acidicola]|uniref:MFS transporter n=1 Tax=Pseudonocardia acidicola TaxID=2724939 RepID=A0ABX1SGF4_9PSEU|nr:MFS transporter [Pseudonocardia acidicola]NMH99642.1 MFS transporter [Pseudonocardia acidicola]